MGLERRKIERARGIRLPTVTPDGSRGTTAHLRSGVANDARTLFVDSMGIAARWIRIEALDESRSSSRERSETRPSRLMTFAPRLETDSISVFEQHRLANA